MGILVHTHEAMPESCALWNLRRLVASIDSGIDGEQVQLSQWESQCARMSRSVVAHPYGSVLHGTLQASNRLLTPLLYRGRRA